MPDLQAQHYALGLPCYQIHRRPIFRPAHQHQYSCLPNLLFSEEFAPRTGSPLCFRRSLRLVFTLSRTDSRSSECEQGRTDIKEITYRCTAHGSIGVHIPLSPPFISHSSFLATMLPPGTRGTALAATRETFDKSNKDAIARRRTILMFRRRFPIHFIHGTGVTRRSWPALSYHAGLSGEP